MKSWTPTSDPTVIIAPSSVGELSAGAVAEALGEGIAEIIQNALITINPIEIDLQDIDGAEIISLPSTNAAGELIEAGYQLLREEATAIIDAAVMTPTDPLSPGTADSYGLGVFIADAQTRGVRQVVLDLRRSVLDDGGAGLLVALGVPGIDDAGYAIPKGGVGLEKLADFDTAKLNVGAAALDYIFLVDANAPAAEGPGLERLREFCQAESFPHGVPIALSWLSNLVHADSRHIRVARIDDLIAAWGDLSEVLDGASAIFSAGAAAHVVARDANDGQVLGLALKDGDTPPESKAKVLSTFYDDTKGEALREAGRKLAADYLRISTVQG